MRLPRLVQGGMGIGVSTYGLASAVSRRGQLGVVSGTGYEIVFARQLQCGDPGGHLRRALEHFPNSSMTQNILNRYFVEGGIPRSQAFVSTPMFTVRPSHDLVSLTVAANFAQVWLAKEGHGGDIGINLLEKVQLPHLSALYGAMLAGVNVVLMGAGIPTQIPSVLQALTNHEPCQYRLQVTGSNGDGPHMVAFDPRSIVSEPVQQLSKPQFWPIVSSVTLAKMLTKFGVDGFVVEGPSAGGHNAPPRGKAQLNANGEPLYGARDVVDFEEFRALGFPFWIAGSYAHPWSLEAAERMGARGIQVGTIFALCKESGFPESLKQHLISSALRGELTVLTSPRVSPTGFPFHVVSVSGTLSDLAVYADRERVCDLGRLRELYLRMDGSIGYRCSAEPVDQFTAKGGDPTDAQDRVCLCNALLATIGFGQRRESDAEHPIVTLGDDLSFLLSLVTETKLDYTADDAVDYLLGEAST